MPCKKVPFEKKFLNVLSYIYISWGKKGYLEYLSSRICIYTKNKT